MEQDIRGSLARCIDRARQAISDLADPVEGYRQATEMQQVLRQASERPALKLRAIMARRVEGAGYSGSTAVGEILGLSKQRAQQLLQHADREDVPDSSVTPVLTPKQVRATRIPEDSLKPGPLGGELEDDLSIPPREIASLFGMRARERAVTREWKFYQDDQPSQLAISYSPEKYAGAIKLDSSDTRPYAIYERLSGNGHQVARVREETEILHPNQAQMTFLGIGPADYVTELTRLAYDTDGTVIEVTVGAFRADRIRLVYEWAATMS